MSRPLLPVSIITGCKGRLEYLKRSVASWLALPIAEVVVVDAGCPDGAADWAESLNDDRLRTVRLPDEPLFRHSAVRNAGARLARSQWLAFFDADILAFPHLTPVLDRLQPGHHYRPHPVTEGLAGQVILDRPTFDRLGGYDEVYRDYSDEDYDLFRRLAFYRSPLATFPAAALRHQPHPHALRTRYTTVPDTRLSMAFNAAYGLAKIDCMNLLGTELKRDFREHLYTTVREKVLAAHQTRHTQRLELDLPTSSLDLVSLARTYVLTLSPPAVSDPTYASPATPVKLPPP